MMRTILVSITFCVIIATCNGQTSDLTDNSKTFVDRFNEEDSIGESISAYTFSSIFFKALQTSDLIETYNNPGPITIFLPADTAFSKFSAGWLDTLLTPERKYDLISLLTYHVLPGNLRAKDLAKHIRRGKGRTAFHTIAGGWIIAEFNSLGEIVLIDERGIKCYLSEKDIKQKNGVIHLVSSVLSPKFQPL